MIYSRLLHSQPSLLLLWFTEWDIMCLKNIKALSYCSPSVSIHPDAHKMIKWRLANKHTYLIITVDTYHVNEKREIASLLLLQRIKVLRCIIDHSYPLWVERVEPKFSQRLYDVKCNIFNVPTLVMKLRLEWELL